MNNRDSSIPYLSENYTGPYLSDGKIQSSVEFGQALPQSRLDALSRLHDSAYAHFEDQEHREAADRIYKEEAAKLTSLFPQLAGNIVEYGNWTSNAFSNLSTNTANGFKFGLLPGAFVGLVIGGVQNMLHLQDLLENGDKYVTDVKKYYASDPMLGNPAYYISKPDIAFSDYIYTNKNIKISTTRAITAGVGPLHNVYNDTSQSLNVPANYRRRIRRKKHQYYL